MATLKDYLGSLVKDLNEARYRADLESARIAQIYANDPILKNFSVPRMKILDTELTIPIAIDSLDESETTLHNPIDNNEMFKTIYTEVKNIIETKSFNTEVSKKLRSNIYSQIDSLEKDIKGGEDTVKIIEKYAEKIADTSFNHIKKDSKELKKYNTRIKKIKLDKNDNTQKEKYLKNMLVANLKQYFAHEVKPVQRVSRVENAQIIAESTKLKEFHPQNIVYIKMKVTEESMEWQTMVERNEDDTEDIIVSKLMQE